MKRDKRSEELARAIEEMIKGNTPPELDDEELDELLQIAKIRLDAARLAAEAGSEAQSVVLDRIVARLGALYDDEDEEEDDTTSESENASSTHNASSSELDLTELQDIISLRREVAERATGVSQHHRDEVWRRVNTRIQAGQPEKRGFFRWPFRRRDREADEFGAALDRMVLGEPIWEAKDSRLGELLSVAQTRQAAFATAGAVVSFPDQRARVWARLRPRLMAKASRDSRSHVFTAEKTVSISWQRLAAAGAAVAVAAAAMGPLPATGFAGHPAAEFVRQVGSFVGASETSAPAEVPSVTEVIDSTTVSAEQASLIVGVPVHEPTWVPAGYGEVSMEYFPHAVTADEGGVHVITFEDTNASQDPDTIIIYQERSSANTIAVETGFAQNVWLTEGAPATYVQGTWHSAEGDGLRWGEEGGQTLLFDLSGTRTIVQATGDIALGDLLAIADGLAAQAEPPTN